MNLRANGLKRAALSALHFSGADGLMAPYTRGAGIIFTLHHVQPDTAAGFAPNGILSVTPEFLECVVRLVLDRGFDVLSLDEVHFRLTEGDLDRPFACFTFDDGYRDNRQYAHPIFEKYALPYAMYVTTDFADGRGDLWWLALEEAIRAANVVEVRVDGTPRKFKSTTRAEKTATFARIYAWLRRIREDDARQTVSELCREHGVDVSSLCADLTMGWDELRALAQDPLVTVGAHTRRHLALSRLPISAARLEIEESAQRLERELGVPCRHFCFPYGDAGSAGQREFDLVKELGFKTAVTTRKDLVHAQHSMSLTALPRVSLNGGFQHARYVKVMLNGLPFALWNLATRMHARPAMQAFAR